MASTFQEIVVADDGAQLPIGSLAITAVPNASGDISYQEVVYRYAGTKNTYRQTFSYDGSGFYTGMTGWVKQ